MACIYSIPILQTPSLHRHTCSCQCVWCAHAHRLCTGHRRTSDVLLRHSPHYSHRKVLSLNVELKLVAKQAPSKQIVFLIYWWICLLCRYVCGWTPSAPAHMWRSEDTSWQDFLSAGSMAKTFTHLSDLSDPNFPCSCKGFDLRSLYLGSKHS